MTRLDIFKLAEEFRRSHSAGAAALLDEVANQDNFNTSNVADSLFDVLKHLAEQASWRME
jgi:hypothetical protein